MRQKIIQIGNSIGVVIPQVLAKNNLKAGDKVIIEKDPLSDTYYVSKKGGKKTELTMEFFTWLKEFTDSHKDVLRELAKH